MDDYLQTRRATAVDEATARLGLWARYCSLAHMRALSTERQLYYLALCPARQTSHCSAFLKVLDLTVRSDFRDWIGGIQALEGLNGEEMEKTLQDEGTMLTRMLQEDELISLLQRGRLNTEQSTKPSETFEEPIIRGHLLNIDVSAFPDTGAATNFISLAYARQHGLRIDGSTRKRVKVGDGSTIRVAGTMTLPFTFSGEPEQHNLTFHVLRKSVHDVILGSAFLRASETFTRFAHRVGRKIREAVGRGIRRVHFLGSQQYVNGRANGVRVDAVPDTGADVSVMSAKFAQANGFAVDDDEEHRILLGFADGSTAKARGVVKNMAWKFGVDEHEETHFTDVYVLPSLPVDLVLGYEFLCQTDAFVEHGQDFWHVEDVDRRNVRLRLCIIERKGGGRKGDSCCEYFVFRHHVHSGKARSDKAFFFHCSEIGRRAMAVSEAWGDGLVSESKG